MLPQLQAEDKNTSAAFSSADAAIPVSLKAEYQELTLKREQLRTTLEQAKAELAAFKAKAKAP
jgi:hypothetical protein